MFQLRICGVRSWCRIAAHPACPVHNFRSKSTAASSTVVEPLMHTKGSSQGEDPVNTMPYSGAKRGSFTQVKPLLGNVFTEDGFLQAALRRMVPKEILDKFTPDLVRFGHRVASEIESLGRACEENPPKHQPYDAWGNRVDELITCDAWKRQKQISAEEGIVAIPYERSYGTWSRVYFAAKLLLYAPSSGLYSCPLAMTDGAAKFFQIHDGNWAAQKSKAFPRLTSRDPNTFWTSGQWMTERGGGSDVADGTDTRAIRQADGSYKLYGYKWFSSATDSDMTLTLARIVDESGEFTKGTRGLSMFYLETKGADGKLNGIEIHKLKDKLGTRQLPTAELLLDGAVAHLVSEEGRGVASITPMLTITRIHNSIAAVGGMRRMLHFARDYATKRTAFGKRIIDHPLHIQTLARMEVETRGSILLIMEIARLLGLEENNLATKHDMQMMRILTPITKLYTAKQSISVASEGLESFGGQGYIEDTGLPSRLRDSQVLSIWEGTTNILSLDVLRSITKTKGETLQAFFADIQTRMDNIKTQDQLLITTMKKIHQAKADLMTFVQSASTQEPIFMEVAARDFAYSLARTYIGALLVEHAAWAESSQVDVTVASRWCEKDLCPVTLGSAAGSYKNDGISHDMDMVMDGYVGNKSKL
ncbi:acyl-CoA dehydrogenase family member 11-like isoform X2 [Amphiura filiformis]|uniref:acyl-CoA dehydrogenase family member 11-like isoform X2 n=1 Tax=Amphiura filiformis TaxID=82378 RepID=UPI003B213183